MKLALIPGKPAVTLTRAETIKTADQIDGATGTKDGLVTVEKLRAAPLETVKTLRAEFYKDRADYGHEHYGYDSGPFQPLKDLVTLANPEARLQEMVDALKIIDSVISEKQIAALPNVIAQKTIESQRELFEGTPVERLMNKAGKLLSKQSWESSGDEFNIAVNDMNKALESQELSPALRQLMEQTEERLRVGRNERYASERGPIGF